MVFNQMVSYRSSDSNSVDGWIKTSIHRYRNQHQKNRSIEVFRCPKKNRGKNSKNTVVVPSFSPHFPINFPSCSHHFQQKKIFHGKVMGKKIFHGNIWVCLTIGYTGVPPKNGKFSRYNDDKTMDFEVPYFQTNPYKYSMQLGDEISFQLPGSSQAVASRRARVHLAPLRRRCRFGPPTKRWDFTIKTENWAELIVIF